MLVLCLLFIHNFLFKVIFEFNLLNKPFLFISLSVLKDGGGVKQGETDKQGELSWGRQWLSL